MKTQRANVIVAVAGLAGVVGSGASAMAQEKWVKGSFKYVCTLDPAQNADVFTLAVTGGTFVEVGATTTRFGRPLINDASTVAAYSGEAPPNAVENARWKVKGKDAVVGGQFSAGGRDASAVTLPKLMGMNGLEVVPLGGGFTYQFDLLNDHADTVTVDLEIYANSGAGSLTLDTFDVLNGARLLHETTGSFAFGEGVTGLRFDLTNPDEYVLIRGTADFGDGLGAQVFSVGITAPSPSVLGGGGALAGVLMGRRRRR